MNRKRKIGRLAGLVLRAKLRLRPGSRSCSDRLRWELARLLRGGRWTWKGGLRIGSAPRMEPY